jgi:N-glycosylase/DNA lyase
VRDDPDHAWIARERVGRLLRAPSMWEDLVKLVLTTNCSWSLTTRMTSNLVERWGACAPGGRRAFPDAATVASIGEAELREVARTGYRAPYLVALARAVAEETVDLEAFERDERPPADLRRDLLRLPGVGPYVAENLLKFQARPAGLALDAWMRAKYARLHHGGRPVRDRTIARRHARLGPWAGLALWFELTRDWHVDGVPGEAWDELA